MQLSLANNSFYYVVISILFFITFSHTRSLQQKKTKQSKTTKQNKTKHTKTKQTRKKTPQKQRMN